MTLTSGVGSGSTPSLLSKVSSTSAEPLARRPSLPAKMTSCMDEPRTVVGLCSPSAQMTASARLLLPLPLGPMITPTPGSKRSSVCLGKDLKPFRRSDLRYTSADLGGAGRALVRVRPLGNAVLAGLRGLAAAGARPAGTGFAGLRRAGLRGF